MGVFKSLASLFSFKKSGSTSIGNVNVSGDNYGALQNITLTDGDFHYKPQVTISLHESQEETIRDVTSDLVNSQISVHLENANNGDIHNSLRMLQNSLQTQGSSLSPRILSRLHIAIGICEIMLGNLGNGCGELHIAYNILPTYPNAIAHKVFALLQEEKYSAAIKMGLEELRKDTSNRNLAFYILQGMQFVDGFNDPLSHIPSELHKTAEIMLGHLSYLRGKNIESWRQTAIEYSIIHPHDSLLEIHACEAALDKAIISHLQDGYLTLNINTQKEATLAYQRLFQTWKHSVSKDFNKNDLLILSRACNLISGLNLLDTYYGESQADFQIIADFIIKQNITDQTLLSRAAGYAVNRGYVDLAKQLLPLIENQKILNTYQLILDYNINGLTALSTHSNNIDDYVEEEKDVIRLLFFINSLGGLNHSSEKKVIDHMTHEAYSIHAIILVSSFALSEHSIELSTYAYKQALELYQKSKDRDVLPILANEALRRQEWRDFITLVNGKIHLNHHSQWLVDLMVCYVNDFPIREDAVDFFKHFPFNDIDRSEYIRGAGHFYFLFGDYDKSIIFLKQALLQEPDDLQTFLSLARLCSILEIPEEKLWLNNNLGDVFSFAGMPEEKIALAHYLREIGRVDDALKLLFNTLEEHSSNPKVVNQYIEFFLFSSQSLDIINPITIASNCFITTKNNDGDTWQFYISNDGSSNIFKPAFIANSNFGKKIIGLKVGDRFQHQSEGLTFDWEVMSIEHGYIAAYRYYLNNANALFPDSRTVVPIKGTPENFDKIFDMVKQQDETLQPSIDLYLRGIPLSIVASRVGASDIEFADTLKFKGYFICSCLGTGEDIVLAERELIKTLKKGVVLDTYTSYISAKIGIFELLKTLFGKICICNSTIQSFEKIKVNYFPFRKQASLVANDGKIGLVEMSEDDCRSSYEYWQTIINQVKESAEVLPVAIPTSITNIERQAMSFSPSILKPIYLANKLDYALLSEDRNYTLFKHILFALENDAESLMRESRFASISLSIIVNFSYRNKLINTSEYTKFILDLIKLKHVSISFTEDCLEETYLVGHQNKYADFLLLIDQLCLGNADIESHFLVAFKFLWQYCQSLLTSPKGIKLATKVLLRLSRHPNWKIVLLDYWTRSPEELQNFIIRWLIGYFNKVNNRS